MLDYQLTHDYQLTQEDILTKFYNSLFLTYELARKMRLKRYTLDKINKEVDFITCDIKELVKDNKLEGLPHGHTTPDGKTIIMDEGYFNQVLSDFPELKNYEKNVLQILFDICYQFCMDHELLHSYLILSGEAKKIGEKHGEEKYEKKIESKTKRLQKKLITYRIKHCDDKLTKDKLTKRIWLFWKRNFLDNKK